MDDGVCGGRNKTCGLVRVCEKNPTDKVFAIEVSHGNLERVV